MVEQIRTFFKEAEEAWGAIPNYVKIFIYSVASSTVTLYYKNELSFDTVLMIFLVNLGIYQVPREIKKRI